MSGQRARQLAWGTFAVSVVLCAATGVLIGLAWSIPIQPNEFGFKGYAILFSLVVGGLGVVLADRRPSNPIGWIFCALGVLAGIIAVTTEYARWALIDEVGRPPGGLWAAWLQEWDWIPLIVGLGAVGWIFPEGRFLSRGWKTAMLITCALAVIPVTLNALVPRLTIFSGFDNPIGLDESWVPGAVNASIGLILPVVFGGATAATVRYRRSRGDERLQIKWLLLAVSTVVVVIAYYGILLTTGADTNHGLSLWAQYVGIASFLAVPISIALGVLKYRLYEIDVVINKAVVYGAIAAFITGVYLLVVIAAGSLTGYAYNPVLSAIAAAVAAVTFQPVRRRAQHVANRLVYGRRATPYEVLAGFSERLGNAYSIDDVLPRMARLLGEGTGATWASIWLRESSELVRAASWPDTGGPVRVPLSTDQPPRTSAGEQWFPVRHQGELLGALTVSMAAGETVTPVQEKLFGDVAGQAGLVLRNVRLVTDIRSSRQRLVAAQDEQRRRIERDIHDGAQQQLVAMSVKLRLLRQTIDRDVAAAAELADQLGAEAQDALENLRDLARGIYPPLLADKGLAPALEAQARKSALPVSVEADDVERFPQPVEAAAYFCVLEALNNVAKYADASRATVRLSNGADELRFEVTDDGRGFDPTMTRYGTGLQGMSDRLAALGGTLEIASEPGLGTTVTGRLPVGGAR